ncbi:MAG: AsmA family protein, partial [Sediminibacterium sp.]|nr:AsmA family protein [Sediminibacterium sp.]
MTSSWKIGLIRGLKAIGILLVTIIIALASLPYFFPDAIARKVRYLVNKEIDGELSFSNARLSFFTHFPSLTLSLNDFVLTGSQPFEKDTLIAGKELGFGINLADLLHQEVSIEKFFLDKVYINIQVNEQGQA